MAPRFQFAAIALLVAAGACGQQTETSIHGVVYESAPPEKRPLPRAFVYASLNGKVVATTRADSQGQYRLTSLPPARYDLTSFKAGYLTLRAAGRDSTTVTLDCSRGCLQQPVDFELAAASVVTGRVLDEFGEPVRRATVTIEALTVASSGHKPAPAATDDQGRFRIGDLPAGSYVITARRRPSAGLEASASRSIELTQGQQLIDFTLSFDRSEPFRVAGNLSGIPLGKDYRVGIQLHPLGGKGAPLSATAGPDGRFAFEQLPVGRYGASASCVNLATGERTDHFLNSIEVSGNTESLSLHAVLPATAAGAVRVAAGAAPKDARIRFTSMDGFGYRVARLTGPSLQFEITDLRPGFYRIEAETRDLYLKGVRPTKDSEPVTVIVLSPGVNRLNIIAAADQSELLGIVRDAGSQPVPHARVALHGASGLQSVQADQNGRFRFDFVIPGEYRVCAWPSIDAGKLRDASSWEKSGCRPETVRIPPLTKAEMALGVAQ